MLTIKHLTIKDLKNHTLIEDLSLTLNNTEKIAIIGEEGNGKSTLLKAIYQRKQVESYTSISGSIDMDFKHPGYLEQQLSSMWKEASCIEYLLKENIEDEIEVSRYNELAHIERTCVKLHIPISLLYSDQALSSLSGGEKVKLQLLKLMMQDCDFLLLDEPTNDLDMETLVWLEQFIKESKAAILFVSHDETLLQACAQRILHMEQLNKKTKCRMQEYRGNYLDYIASRSARYQKEVQLARKEKQDYRKKKEKLNDMKNALHDALNDTVRNPGVAASLKRKMKNITAQERRIDQEGFAHVDSVEEAIDVYFEDVAGIAGKVILQAELGVMINNQTLISPFVFDIRGQDKIAIIGRNGCGKTQLIKQMYELLKERTDITLGYMPQQYLDIVDEHRTPIEFLLDEGDHKDVSHSRELLGRMKFTSEEMTHEIQALSEGQKAKMYLLRFIKRKCNVLLLDEPTRNLSPLSAPMIRAILNDYQGCIIAVSHDRLFLQQVVKKIYKVEHYQIQESEDM